MQVGLGIRSAHLPSPPIPATAYALNVGRNFIMTVDHIYITSRTGDRREIEWGELNQLKKDILWAYDENVGDLHNPFIPAYSFPTKYWEYLKLDGDKFFRDEERRFYKQGVLIITLCMAVEYIDTTSGNQQIFGGTKITEIIDYVNNFEPTDIDEKRLKEVIILGLNIADSMTPTDLKNTDGFDHKDLDDFHKHLDWVDRTFVKSYFQNKVK